MSESLKSPDQDAESKDSLSLSVETTRSKGALHQLTGVILSHGGDISSVAILDSGHEVETISFEINELEDHAGLMGDLEAIEGVKAARENSALKNVFGKRVIIIGGGRKEAHSRTGTMVR